MSVVKGDFDVNFHHLMRFMEIGPGDSQYDEKLFEKFWRGLPALPPCGWPVMPNTSPDFHSYYASMPESPIYARQIHGRNEAMLWV